MNERSNAWYDLGGNRDTEGQRRLAEEARKAQQHINEIGAKAARDVVKKPDNEMTDRERALELIKAKRRTEHW